MDAADRSGAPAPGTGPPSHPEQIEPGQKTNFSGAPSIPRPASTVVVVRGGEELLELLLVRRTPAARFMAGVWVFPGGAVDPADGVGDAGHRAAAVRELEEETGISLPVQALAPLARWITPAQLAVRFDTVFYLAECPPGAEPRVDGAEIVDSRWASPRAALQESAAGRLALVLPTIKQLEALAVHETAGALLAVTRAGGEQPPIEPRIVIDGDRPRILLPGEPEF